MADLAHDPVLQGEPDAVRSPVPLPPAASAIYLALLIGIAPTAFGAVWMGLMLRSPRVVLWSVGVGIVGIFAPLVPLFGARLVMGEELNIGLVVLCMRLVAVGLGALLYRVLRPAVRGHQHLDGPELPLLWVLGPAFALLFLGPPELAQVLEFPLLMALAGLA